MRLLATALMLATVGLAGCTDVAAPDVALLVNAAELQEGDCAFGVRDDASDPEWCHVLEVRVTNQGFAPAELGADRWSATGDDLREYTFPRVEGADRLEPDSRADIFLRFSAPPDVRLQELRYRDDITGTAASTTIRSYGES